MASKLKQHQVIALVEGKKAAATRVLSDLHKVNQKPGLFNGLARQYAKTEELGEDLAPENKNVEFRAKDNIAQANNALVDLWDIVLAQDATNAKAKADIKLADKVLAKDVPVTFLLFLEKQLTDLKTYLENLPVLELAESWEWDSTKNLYKAEPVKTSRKVKVKKVLEKAPATDKHPAQVEVYDDEKVVGYWTTTKLSAAVRASEKADMLERTGKLLEAVKLAREEANSTEAELPQAAAPLLKYIFGDLTPKKS